MGVTCTEHTEQCGASRHEVILVERLAICLQSTHLHLFLQSTSWLVRQVEHLLAILSLDSNVMTKDILDLELEWRLRVRKVMNLISESLHEPLAGTSSAAPCSSSSSGGLVINVPLTSSVVQPSESLATTADTLTKKNYSQVCAC